jgi:hypothetical protein
MLRTWLLEVETRSAHPVGVQTSSLFRSVKKGIQLMKRFVSSLKYARYAMGSLTSVLFAACVGGS